MIKILIGLLVVLIVMVQVLYLERLKAYRRQLLVLFTIVLAVGLFFALRDSVASFAKTPPNITYQAPMKDYDGWYVEAMLAYDAQDYDLALVYFHQLYQLKPSDQSYYREYADTLLMNDPRNPQLKTIMAKLSEQPDRDPGWLLLFARYEQVLGHAEKAQEYYEEALGKLK